MPVYPGAPCLVASLDRECLGPSAVDFGAGRMVTGRGTSDKETRRKPLAFAGDAPPVTLYMEFEWHFRRFFALG